MRCNLLLAVKIQRGFISIKKQVSLVVLVKYQIENKIYSIKSLLKNIEENAGNPELKLAPQNAIQSVNNYGTKGYGGPCPPEGHGPHQYIITIHALNIDTLGLDENTNPDVMRKF